VSRKTAYESAENLLFLATLTALLLFVGQALGGRGGLTIALMFAGVMNFVAYWWSDKIVFADVWRPGNRRSAGTRLVCRGTSAGAAGPYPYAAGLPHPTGDAEMPLPPGAIPRTLAVAVTEGIMRLLDREELEGVLAQ